MRTITIRYTAFRECPNCEGRGDDGASWRPAECRRCMGRGTLVTGVEVAQLLEPGRERAGVEQQPRGVGRQQHTRMSEVNNLHVTRLTN